VKKLISLKKRFKAKKVFHFGSNSDVMRERKPFSTRIAYVKVLPSELFLRSVITQI